MQCTLYSLLKKERTELRPFEKSTPEELLSGNPYPGRGILLGRTSDGKFAVAVYFIMGRSENSRNRVFAIHDGVLSTRPFDESKVKDPSLIIYNAMRQCGNDLVVTNGDQTDTICDFLSRDQSFRDALCTRCFEPDGPNYTPRISGIIHFGDDDLSYELSILKSADAEGSACCRQFFMYPALPGIGHLIHTYETDGSPIPSFNGEPRCVCVGNDIASFASALWTSLDENNRISLCVRATDLATGESKDIVINKNLL